MVTLKLWPVTIAEMEPKMSRPVTHTQRIDRQTL